MAKKVQPTELNVLFYKFDKAKNDAKEAEDAKKELSTQIKEALGETEHVDTDEYVVTYKYDKDKETEEFNEELMKTKAPKEYAKLLSLQESVQTLTKKYTKKKTVPGARKLIVTRKEE